jgi:hypothetical protein
MSHYLDVDGVTSMRGSAAEKRYTRKLRLSGIEFREATRLEQKLHIDYLLDSIRVEVKACKCVCKQDDHLPADMILLELHGYQPYNDGWLMGSADLIAFERPNGDFWHYPRKRLLHWILNKKSDTIKEYDHQPIMYQQYYRLGNENERFLWVPLNDIPLEAIKL